MVRCIRYDRGRRLKIDVRFFIPMHLSFMVLSIVVLISNVINWIAQHFNIDLWCVYVVINARLSIRQSSYGALQQVDNRANFNVEGALEISTA